MEAPVRLALMSRSNHPIQARHAAGKIHVTLANGLEIAFPITGNPDLSIG